MLDHATTTVEAAVPAAIRSPAQATRLPLQRRGAAAFTLAELVVTVGVLALLVFLFTQLMNSAATVTALAHKQMDADSQTRQLLDRMAIDFAQMVKRSDVDYYVKSSWFASGTPPPPSGVTGVRTVRQSWLVAPSKGNDTIAFYSTVPGYYPSTGSQSPVSLVAYRVNSDSTNSAYNKMERMGKGLVWNAVSHQYSCRLHAHPHCVAAPNCGAAGPDAESYTGAGLARDCLHAQPHPLPQLVRFRSHRPAGFSV